MIGALWESIRFVLVFNPIPRQLFHTYIFLLSLLNHLLVTEKLERLKGRGYSIYDVKFDRRAQSCVPAQIWGKQENDYFKQFRCRSKFEFTIGCLCSNMNTTREVVFQALSKHLEADRKLYFNYNPIFALKYEDNENECLKPFLNPLKRVEIARQLQRCFSIWCMEYYSNCLINRLIIRQLKRCIKTREKKIKYCYVEFGPDHTNAFSFENTYISMRLGVSSTLLRWAFSSKTNRVENVLDGGSKRIHVVF